MKSSSACCNLLLLLLAYPAKTDQEGKCWKMKILCELFFCLFACMHAYTCEYMWVGSLAYCCACVLGYLWMCLPIFVCVCVCVYELWTRIYDDPDDFRFVTKLGVVSLYKLTHIFFGKTNNGCQNAFWSAVNRALGQRHVTHNSMLVMMVVAVAVVLVL